jgi:hypothetical protein
MLLDTSCIPLTLIFIIPDTKSVYTVNHSIDIALYKRYILLFTKINLKDITP